MTAADLVPPPPIDSAASVVQAARRSAQCSGGDCIHPQVCTGCKSNVWVVFVLPARDLLAFVCAGCGARTALRIPSLVS